MPIDLRGASLSRPGVILKTEEGAFPLLVMPFYFFTGGPILPGTQWFAWIHLADTLGLLMLALEDERVHGPLNATAPETQTNRDFAQGDRPCDGPAGLAAGAGLRHEAAAGRDGRYDHHRPAR